MTFLVMDTSGEYAVLALADEAREGAVQAAVVFEGRRALSQKLFGQLDGLLKGSGLTLEEMTAFAVGLGPGSFTGVRVGVTTMKTLAQVTGRPLVGVGTLEAYAAGWGGGDAAIVPALPSRRGEVYAAVYKNGQTVEPPFAARVEELTARLAGWESVIVCGQTSLLPGWGGLALAQLHVPPEGLAKIAARRLNRGEADDPLGLVPLYVVPPSISTPKATMGLAKELV